MKIPTQSHQRRKNPPLAGALSVGPTAKYSDFTEFRSAVLERSEEGAALVARESNSRMKSFVAVMLSPKTLLPAAVSLSDNRVVIHSLDAKLKLAEGYYGGRGNNDCQRQHALPGRDSLSTAEGGFGPLIYYGGALSAGTLNSSSCIYSDSHRTRAAAIAWDNFKSMKLAYREEPEESEEFSYEQETLDRRTMTRVIDEWVQAYAHSESLDSDDLFDDDPASDEHLTVTRVLFVRLDDETLRDSILHELPGAAEEFDAGVQVSFMRRLTRLGWHQKIEVTVTFSRELHEESETFSYRVLDDWDHDVESLTASWEQPSDEAYAEDSWTDIMQAETVLNESGLVVWTNPMYNESILGGDFPSFTPPDAAVLARMNPTATTAKWFTQIFADCAMESRVPGEYLVRLYSEIQKVGHASPTSPMIKGWVRAVDELQGTPPSKLSPPLRYKALVEARPNGRGPKMNVIPLDTWQRQAAAIPDIGQE